VGVGTLIVKRGVPRSKNVAANSSRAAHRCTVVTARDVYIPAIRKVLAPAVFNDLLQSNAQPNRSEQPVEAHATVVTSQLTLTREQAKRPSVMAVALASESHNVWIGTQRAHPVVATL
jgi:hypothetical protein